MATTSPLRWGILGCGGIARQFAASLQSLPDAKLIAVGSRSQEKADAFGAEFGASHRHGSYQALAEDPEVDVVYIATPHPVHAEDALLCLSHGKAVLCEKPFTLNALQAEQVIQMARAKNLFLMEAMWTRFFPLMARLRQLLADGAIGEPRLVQADFGFRAEFDPKSRLFDPALGGGALLDVGCYVLSLASMIFGTPSQITGIATLGETGVDEQAAIVLGYPGGQIATLSCAVRTNMPQEAIICGTEGRIKLHSPFWVPTAMTLLRDGQKSEEITVPYDGKGHGYQAQEVKACLNAGRMESAILPLNETLSVMKTMDTLRAQWGLTYPAE